MVADDNAIAAALPASGEPSGPYRSQGSLQAAFQQAVELAKRNKTTLNSGHILLAVTNAEHGTVVRTLQNLAIDPNLLRDRTASLLAHEASPAPGR